MYDPRLVRFTGVDPVEGGAAIDYDYVNGAPANGLDLSGTFSCDACASLGMDVDALGAAIEGAGQRACTETGGTAVIGACVVG